MSWSDPVVGSALFDTNDIPTEGNFDSYVFNNLLSLMHALETPTTPDLDIVSLSTEETLYSVTVPANSLGVNGSLDVIIVSDYLANTGGSDGHVTVRLKFGGTTIRTWGPDRFADSAARRLFEMRVKLFNQNSATAQLLTWDLGWGTGIVGTPDYYHDTAAINTAVDQSLLVTVQWTVASANKSFRRLHARTLIGQN